MHFHLMRRLNLYLNFGYLHGIRYLGSLSKWPGRLYWMIILLFSFVAIGRIFDRCFYRYNKDSVNVNLDTAYLHWTNTFPAVSVCLTSGNKLKPIWDFMKSYMQTHNISLPKREVSYYKLVRDYLFITPLTPIDPFDYCSGSNTSCGINTDILKTMLFPRTCSDFMHNLTYLERSYNRCEKFFKMSQTEIGTCFTANGINYFDKDFSNLPLKYTRNDFSRTLSFHVDSMESVSFDLYVHSPEDQPNVASFDRLIPRYNSKRIYFYNTIEIFNEREIREKSIDQRHCRFPDERLSYASNLSYSFSNCFMQMRIGFELEACNCTLHTSPYYSNASIKAKELHYTGEDDCVQSCIEMEINANGMIEYESNDDSAMLSITILNAPHIRYVRTVVVDSLELVVSIGGVAGLFLGASLLSVVEFLYIWLIRKL